MDASDTSCSDPQSHTSQGSLRGYEKRASLEATVPSETLVQAVEASPRDVHGVKVQFLKLHANI